MQHTASLLYLKEIYRRHLAGFRIELIEIDTRILRVYSPITRKHIVGHCPPSILPSVTNMSLMQVARDLGITVEKRPIVAEEELPTFAEVDACGTAVVITPISSVTIHGKVIEYGHECGPVSQKLYDRLTGIQKGELEDTHNWLYTI